jgi:hypothetical protein
MQIWTEMVQHNIGRSKLDADEFIFGAMPEEHGQTEVVAKVSPSLKMRNKKRTRNFSEGEDILLALAWLEISMDPFKILIKLVVLIDIKFMSTTTSTRPLNLIVMSVLSHIVGGIIQASVSKFCSWCSQVLRSNKSGVIDQDRYKVFSFILFVNL